MRGFKYSVRDEAGAEFTLTIGVNMDKLARYLSNGRRTFAQFLKVERTGKPHVGTRCDGAIEFTIEKAG